MAGGVTVTFGIGNPDKDQYIVGTNETEVIISSLKLKLEPYTEIRKKEARRIISDCIVKSIQSSRIDHYSQDKWDMISENS